MTTHEQLKALTGQQVTVIKDNGYIIKITGTLQQNPPKGEIESNRFFIKDLLERLTASRCQVEGNEIHLY